MVVIKASQAIKPVWTWTKGFLTIIIVNAFGQSSALKLNYSYLWFCV